MAATIIDGKAIAKQIRLQVAEDVKALKEKGITPSLSVLLVGDDEGSAIYVRNKQRACKECGIASEVVRLPATATQQEVMAEIERLNKDKSVHGVLVQLPMPKHIDEKAALDLVDWRKDVDGLHVINAGALMMGQPGVDSCTPAGCIQMLKRSGVPIAGAEAVVIGRSVSVGKPMAMMLLRENATVTICHSRTRNIAEVVRRADIVVAALGRAKFVTGDMIKPGAAVIDVGINRQPDGKLLGDVDFDAVVGHAGWISPVPGGVGPMTIAMLMVNLVEVARAHGA
jgi:methylenetetrahydrofolate dehydrogenase (NADP+)/methenyltetrahydrofolate cyclohydrolase